MAQGVPTTPQELHSCSACLCHHRHAITKPTPSMSHISLSAKKDKAIKDCFKDHISKKRKLDSCGETEVLCNTVKEKLVIQHRSAIPSGETSTMVAYLDKLKMAGLRSRDFSLVLTWTLHREGGGGGEEGDSWEELEDEGRLQLRSCGEVKVDVGRLLKCIDAEILAGRLHETKMLQTCNVWKM